MIDPLAFSLWAEEQDPLVSYLVLALSTFSEYLIPILPAELIPTLLAVVNAATERPLLPLILAGAIGSTLGGLLDYGVGRYMISTRHDTWLHRLFRRPTIARWVDILSRHFERHGTWYILLNRFLPPIRQVLFVVAGTAKLPLWRVATAAFISALAWMGLVVSVGTMLGLQLEHALVWLSRYAMGMALLVSTLLLISLWKARRGNLIYKGDTEER